MTGYDALLEKLVLRGKPVASKKLENNTYGVRMTNDASQDEPRYREAYAGESGIETPDAVGVKLHATVVLVFSRDGRVILDTGGWKTVTTKDRINTYLPAGHTISSIKGQWRLFSNGFDSSVPYVDGLQLQLVGGEYIPVPGTFPSASREEELAIARKKLNADIKAFVAKLPEKAERWRQQLDAGELSFAGDCFYCQGIVTTPSGDVVRDNGHLWSHLREGYLFPTLVLAALADKGYRNPQFIFQLGIQQGAGKQLEQNLAKYLRKRLEPGEEPAGDRGMREWYVSQAVDVLQKPTDFGYFGGDETLWKTSAPTWTKHRDSSNEEVANFEVVWEALKAEFPELLPADLDEDGHPARSFTPEGVGALYVFGAGHWAVGHIDQIVVPVKLDATRPVDVDNLHPAFIRVCEFGRQVRDYPVLDGAEAIAERLDEEDRRNEARQYLDEPTDEQVSQLVVAVLRDHEEWPGYMDTDQWLEVINSLELTPASWLAARATAL